MTTEPSVWDYLVAKIQFWKQSDIDFEPYLRDEKVQKTDQDALELEISAIEENGSVTRTAFSSKPSARWLGMSVFQRNTGKPVASEMMVSDDSVGSDEIRKNDAVLEELSNPESHSPRFEDRLEPLTGIFKLPWRLLLGLLIIFIGQIFMEIGTGALNPFMQFFAPDHPEYSQTPVATILFYIVAAILLVWSFIEGELRAPSIRKVDLKGTTLEPVKTKFLVLSLPFLISAFVLMGNNRFTLVNLVCWVVGVVFFINAIWVDAADRNSQFWTKVKKTLTKGYFQLNIRWWDIMLVGVAIIAVFFRMYLLDSVPAEMFSDQAEKLLDVQDVLDGQYSIFFPRNTGREAFQMYWSALMAQFVGIQFLTLKLGTAICGLLMLPYVYLLGKEIGNKRVGLYAVFFASIAYWPNVIARVGLRYILYAAFAAPVLYYLYRGLKRQHRNDFIMAGIFLGIGLHGYSSFRFIPIVVGTVAVIYWLHNLKDQKKIQTAIYSVLIIGLVSLVIFLPLMRYWLQNPEMFSYRMATRLGQAEQSYPENPILIFFKNTWRALTMFFHDNGEVWVHSVTHRPALDLITAGIYFIGCLVLVLDYFKKWSWEYLSLMVSIPLLLMPSILSLAFPAENPCLNRTSAAMIPVFVIAGFGMETLMTSMRRTFGTTGGAKFVVVLTVFLLVASAGLNYDLVFNQYADQFVRGAWNTSDIGQVIEEFANSFGSYDTAYVVPFPHWVDTRLVGINAGAPRKDFALSQEFIPDTLLREGSKLFIFKYDDNATMEQLTTLYPEGKLKFYNDQYEGKDFYIFIVP